MSENCFWKLLLNKDRLFSLHTKKGQVINAEICASKGLSWTNPRCPDPTKGFKDAVRSSNISELKSESLAEEGKIIIHLMTMRCRDCCTHKSPRSQGIVIYLYNLCFFILRIFGMHGPEESLEYQTFSGKNHPGDLHWVFQEALSKTSKLSSIKENTVLELVQLLPRSV